MTAAECMDLCGFCFCFALVLVSAFRSSNGVLSTVQSLPLFFVPIEPFFPNNRSSLSLLPSSIPLSADQRLLLPFSVFRLQ
jgi:hypothetical protein